MEELEYEYKAKELKDAMVRLLENKDFKKIFTDEFMHDSLVQLGYNFGSQANMRNNIAEQITARTYVKQFIDGIIVDGFQAEQIIEDTTAEMKGE